MKNLHIDCDPGIDDGVALLFALSHPSLNIRAITTVSGNLLADTCSLNARKILHLSKRDDARHIPIAKGPQKPLVRPYPRDPFSHGVDGLGDLGITDAGGLRETGQFAADLILETVNKHQEEGISLLCIGPLTNIALALMKDPELPTKVSELLFIGGSFGFHTAGALRATGDNPVSEWNVYVDPEAADLVFKAGFNLTALGLDVVTRPDLELSVTHRERLVAAANDSNPGAKFLLDVVAFGASRNFASWCCLIDSVAVAAAIDISLTIVDRRERKEHRWPEATEIKAARDIDVAKFLDLLVNTLVGSHKRLPKCEHHLHIEGTVSPELLFTLAAKNSITLDSADDPAFTSVATLYERYRAFTSLDDFLHYYFIGFSVLQTQADFELLAYEHLKTVFAQGLRHTEIFFDPQAHSVRGISYQTVISGKDLHGNNQDRRECTFDKRQ
ncbi:hypothetical protein BHE90_013387 [Fusarium euwallaceae]|uniref:Inosine/uridine-preferring nucleoside hydrolase domain-containing protein n=1 Tax=Fusarium euwallaceae TaxID=1147111 RepID=A0A430L935_9HYPO|nr:hypothetical protein BHE90_013387 [Fusarium euwallaceae]